MMDDIAFWMVFCSWCVMAVLFLWSRKEAGRLQGKLCRTENRLAAAIAQINGMCDLRDDLVSAISRVEIPASADGDTE